MKNLLRNPKTKHTTIFLICTLAFGVYNELTVPVFMAWGKPSYLNIVWGLGNLFILVTAGLSIISFVEDRYKKEAWFFKYLRKWTGEK